MASEPIVKSPTVTHEPSVTPKPPIVESPVYHPETGFTQPQMDELAKHGWNYAGDGKFEYKLCVEDGRFGRGISQILMNSDKTIGDDTIMSARESGLSLACWHIRLQQPLHQKFQILETVLLKT